MNILKLLALSIIAVLFASCKASQPTGPPSGPTPSLLEVAQILDTTGTMFLQFANETNGDANQAILATEDWLSGLPNVQSATSLDSVNIDIVLNSGLKATFCIDQINDSGYSVMRGGHGEATLKSIGDMVQGMKSANTITNDNVLMFAAAYSEFGLSAAHMQSLFASSPINFKVTILKDSQCTYQMMQQFGTYGLVILDTHGKPESVLLGTQISIPTPLIAIDEATLKSLIISQTSQDAYNRLLSGDLRFISEMKVNTLQPGWQNNLRLTNILELMATSQYIRSLPTMTGTVIFGNMCYSGWTLASTTIPSYQVHKKINGVDTTITRPAKVVQYDAIGTAFSGRTPISYYGYALMDGSALQVEDGFAKKMEDTLVTNLVVNFDSTKIANLQFDGSTLFKDPYPTLGNYFQHFGADNYSYAPPCVDSFTDARDGQVYKAVCIGNQTWMAQNLNYYVPGSLCCNDNSSDCDTLGKLYTRAEVLNGATPSSANPSGVQGICPKGWHLPSKAEWVQLITFLGGPSVAGGAMKSTSSLWWSPNLGATNSSGFSALPGGEAYDSAGVGGANLYVNENAYAFFHTCEPQIADHLDDVQIVYQTAAATYVSGPGDASTFNNSCRCVKDP